MFDNDNQTQQAAATTAPVPANPSTPTVDPVITPATPGAVDNTAAPAAAADQSFNAMPLSNDPLSAPTVDPAASPAAPAADNDIAAAPTADLSLAADPVSDTATGSVSDPLAGDTSSDLPAGSDDLLSIKQDALQNLSPLLSQLEQSPEEKFRTTMMLIQASDDQSLIQTAYAAAKEIEDEKVRAQALLDIVNEINYFTQAKASTPSQ